MMGSAESGGTPGDAITCSDDDVWTHSDYDGSTTESDSTQCPDTPGTGNPDALKTRRDAIATRLDRLRRLEMSRDRAGLNCRLFGGTRFV